MSFDHSANPAILEEATPGQLEKAVAYNHMELFKIKALVQGGEVKTSNGLTWTYAGAGNGATVCFPSLDESSAGAQLDEMMAYYRAHLPQSIGCWSLNPPQPADIGVRLLARGFQPGWQPCWMALDIPEIRTDFPLPDGLQIYAGNERSVHNTKELPYVDDGELSRLVKTMYADRIQRFIAVLHGKVVGHSSVFLTAGAYGTAGIYDVGVVPAARQRGVGKAVVIAACLHARERGYRYAVLNATGRRMYEQIGFKWISNGRTWWANDNRFLMKAPLPDQIALAEAAGRGDIAALDSLNKGLTADALNMPPANSMTLIQIALHFRHRDAAEWLIEHGAVYSVLDAWDMGAKERAAALLKSHPRQVDQLYGDLQITLLHVAAEKNDIELAKLALAAKPDVEIKDHVYNSTALGWAQHFKRGEIARMITEYVTEK